MKDSCGGDSLLCCTTSPSGQHFFKRTLDACIRSKLIIISRKKIFIIIFWDVYFLIFFLIYLNFNYRLGWRFAIDWACRSKIRLAVRFWLHFDVLFFSCLILPISILFLATIYFLIVKDSGTMPYSRVFSGKPINSVNSFTFFHFHAFFIVKFRGLNSSNKIFNLEKVSRHTYRSHKEHQCAAAFRLEYFVLNSTSKLKSYFTRFQHSLNNPMKYSLTQEKKYFLEWFWNMRK